MEVIDRTIGGNIYGIKTFLGHMMALSLIPVIVWLLVKGMKNIRIGRIMGVVTVISLMSAYRAGDFGGLLTAGMLIRDLFLALRPLLTPKVLKYVISGLGTGIEIGSFLGGLMF